YLARTLPLLSVVCTHPEAPAGIVVVHSTGPALEFARIVTCRFWVVGLNAKDGAKTVDFLSSGLSSPLPGPVDRYLSFTWLAAYCSGCGPGVPLGHWADAAEATSAPSRPTSNAVRFRMVRVLPLVAIWSRRRAPYTRGGRYVKKKTSRLDPDGF